MFSNPHDRDLPQDPAQPWSAVSSTDLCPEPLLRRDVVRLHGGGLSEYVYRPRGGRAALIVPVTPGGDMVLLRQYRYPLRSTLTEIVAGGVETGETPLQAAKRELIEEAGGEAGEWLPLPLFCPQPSFTGQVFHPFLAFDVRLGASQPEESELLSVQVTPLREVYRALEAGEIESAPSALTLFHARAELTRRGLL